jgi:hypothetical protein
MNLMIFCDVAEELVGVSAEELVDEIKDEELYTLPDEIEDLLGSIHTFQVFDKHLSGSFSVYSIMDRDTVPVPSATTSQGNEESNAVTGEARLKSTRLQKPNKRLRGGDWIN